MTAPVRNFQQSSESLESGLPKIRQLLTPKETAEYLRCDVDHIYRLLDEGELTGENHALRTEGKTQKGLPKQRFIRIHRQSVVDFRKRRRYTA